MADHSVLKHASDTLQERDMQPISESLQSVVKRLTTNGVVAQKDLDAARKRAKGKRSSSKRYQNQK